jgi:hypothetical protein
LPWSEDFESFALCGTNSDCENEICALTNGFINETNGTVDDIDWRTDEDGTPSGDTGPDVDYNPGTTSGNYLYLEASGSCNGQTAYLISPCIDLGPATTPALKFAYHMDGDDMGTLAVDVFANGVWTNNLFNVSGDQGVNWIQGQVLLTSYTGQVINIRIRGTTGTGYQSDMAIDDIRVEDVTGIGEENLTLFMLYPNPVTHELNISSNTLSGPVEMLVYNSLGSIVLLKKQMHVNPSSKLDVSMLPAGMYVIRLVSNTGVYARSFLKK